MDNSFNTVKSLTEYIKLVLENDASLSRLSVKGEISGCSSISKKGIIYFTLKDESTQISCVLYENWRKKLQFKIRDGLEILAFGSVKVYGTQGKYQLHITHAQPSKEGDLHELFLKTKADLEQKGYFNLERKRKIPEKLRKIALITSESSAAVHDFLSVLERRFPLLRVDLYHSTVQGESLEREIVSAIDMANKKADACLIVITRGGGSKEDLFGFNNPLICEAVFNSKIPVAAAIGHVEDETLIELTADIKGGTPSIIAEKISERFYNSVLRTQRAKEELINYAERRIEKEEIFLKNWHSSFSLLVENKISKEKLELDRKIETIKNELDKYINNKKQELEKAIIILNSNNPENISKKGYPLIYKNGEILASFDDFQKEDILDIVFGSFTIKAEVKERKEHAKQ